MSSEDPPTNLNGIIARSRSRYKGNRSNQPVTSTQGPTRPRPKPLEQHRYSSKFGQEVWEGLSNPEEQKIRNATLTASRGVTEDVYNYSTTPRTCDGSATLPKALSDRHDRVANGEKPTQSQITKHDPPSGGGLGKMKVVQQATQDQIEQPSHEPRGYGPGEHVLMRKLNPDLTAARGEHRKLPVEYIRPKGGQIEDRQGQSKVQPAHSTPTISAPSKLEQQIITRSMQMESHQDPNKASTLQKRSLTHRRKASNIRDELKRTISAPMPVEPPDVTIKPAFDAPVSAVNAGERRVRVYFDQTSLSVPVMPSTTPLDIIREAGVQLSLPIDATTNVLLESFKQLGLERPLRRYERIRDVMNSWDSDAQNSLNIVLSPTGGRDDDLDLTSVMQSQPGDTSVHIYHSNAPGSWDKRWISLRSDGQVLMAKKDGKETSNICHLSDFDIYVPTKRHTARKIKPPKKYCFAVKSQQKSAMFLTTENFVHFFAAGDRELAMAWYKAVQEWRSWYLVNVMGEGQNAIPISSVLQGPSDEVQAPTRYKGGRASFDSGSQQQTATFVQPQQLSKALSPDSLPTRNRGPPPVSFPKKLPNDTMGALARTHSNAHHRPSIIQSQPLLNAEPEPFALQSLLGRTYTQRQEAVAKGNRVKEQNQELPDHHVRNHPTVGGDELQRRPSGRPKQKPLLDLTPKCQVPPQHRNKGHGVLPEHMPKGALVEAATNPDPTWDSRNIVGADIRKPPTFHNQYPNDKQAQASPRKREPAFTGGRLCLAQAQGQDSSGTGQGMKTGKPTAREPLLNMITDEPWAKGSLLDRIKNADSGPGQTVERVKQHEVKDPVGEGL